MTELRSIKIIDGALHESPQRGGTIILRGVIDPNSLKFLQFDDYQREALPLASLSKLTNALKAGETLPDIEIGMRGDKCRSLKDDWFLQDECFVIDGQQRINACINFMSAFPGKPFSLGAAIHFGTTKVWERQRFRVLNSDRVKVSPNILARNLREDHPMLNAIHKLTENDGFALSHRVSWDQNMKRGKLITALNFMRVTGNLHAHISPGGQSRIDDLAAQLDRMAERATISQVRENMITFFDALDDIWGVRAVHYREFTPHLKGGFLQMLASFYSDHLDFWRGVNGWKLFIDTDLRRKMAGFKLTDPGIAPLAGSDIGSRSILYEVLIKHVNSGKRTKRLTPRPGVKSSTSTGSTEEE